MRLLRPLEPIQRQPALVAGCLIGGTILLAWAVATYGGMVRTDFLPEPHKVVTAILTYGGDGRLLEAIWVSSRVVLLGFLFSALLSIPIGLFMGSFRLVQAGLEPTINFIRYLPVTSMVPLLILWLGIGIEQKIAVIFIGTFFQQVIMVTDVVARTPKDLVYASYTLGTGRFSAVFRVLLPYALPGICDAMRITMGWAWTYLVVAELVAANSGLGYMSLQAMRGFRVDIIFMAILVIGFLGMISDMSFRLVRQRLLSWAE